MGLRDHVGRRALKLREACVLLCRLGGRGRGWGLLRTFNCGGDLGWVVTLVRPEVQVGKWCITCVPLLQVR